MEERLRKLLSKIEQLQIKMHDNMNVENVDQISNYIDKLDQIIADLEKVYEEGK
jgi:hypothetical protein